MCHAQGPQRNDTGEARTRGPSVSSQALYHWATALPNCGVGKNRRLSLVWNQIVLLFFLIHSQSAIKHPFSLVVENSG